MSGAQWICFEPDISSGWSESDFARFITSCSWVFAKTMPQNPHEYALRRDMRSDMFDNAVRYIREHGDMDTFSGKPYKGLCFRGYRYWTMGAVLAETILINRKTIG